MSVRGQVCGCQRPQRTSASTSQISKGTPPVDDKTPDVNKRKRQSGPDSPRKRVMTAWTGDELELLFNQVTEGRRGKDLNVPGRTAKQAHDLWV